MFAVKCNKCGTTESKDLASNKNWRQLDYHSSIGYYYTIHLCDPCHELFKEFLKS